MTDPTDRLAEKIVNKIDLDRSNATGVLCVEALERLIAKYARLVEAAREVAKNRQHDVYFDMIELRDALREIEKGGEDGQ